MLALSYSTFVSAQTRLLLSREGEFNKLYNSMVYVQGGDFMMGTNPEKEEDALKNDAAKPRHKVAVNSFYISRYEVTQALWKAVMGSNPSKFKGDNLPVENVSYDDCKQFISKLNKMTGENYRLPTEAEWEYAARGGNSSRGYTYGGGDYFSDVAWHGPDYTGIITIIDIDGNSDEKTHPVGSKEGNELGLYDMSGNVCEWCSDRYGPYNNSYQKNPTGPSSGTYRIIRGGSWYDSPYFCRVSYRRYYTPDSQSGTLGLRLVCNTLKPRPNMPKANDAPNFGLG